ncbi:MAG: dihydroxy-acid dehydratase [Dehalococcoidia bacterium]|nr:dihydroxy-acid dehydratase [Dehalococcoidia bacterium]
MKSDSVKKGVGRAPHRSLLYALGHPKEDMERPFIGVVNSYNTVIPGHMHLQSVANAVREGIRAGGGVPFEFNTIGVCDGIAMNHYGMKFSLPSRELIADAVEIMAEGHAFDALVFIPNCDKIVPGMLIAAARLNLPCVFVSGGPMLPGRMAGENGPVDIDLIHAFEGAGKVLAHQMTEKQLEELEQRACPGCGSCSPIATANTMNCLTEALGLALPGNGTIPAPEGRRLALAFLAGEQVMEVLKKGLKPLDILTPDAFHNAFAVDMALGGSTNTVLHVPAVAHAAGVDFPLSRIDEISQAVPHICDMRPYGKYGLADLDVAGGVPAVMKEISKRLKPGAMTVTGKTIGDVYRDAEVRDRRVIHPFSEPLHKTGGIAILTGNLAPDGAVVKAAGVAEEMMVHEGPARCFNSEEEVTKAITSHIFQPGDVLVVRYEGPKGGPGMREMLTPTSLLSGMGADKTVALITDGRFSGGSRGAAIGHVSPEAAARGPIAAIRDGDIIRIDITKRTLDVKLDKKEIDERLASLPPFVPKVRKGYLGRYSKLVSSASTGAVFENEV